MPTTASPSDPLAHREIRVFISSTFRDMMKERDLLVKRVVPALRRICAKRFVTFTEVDLRWGITEEQAAEGKVLPLCLAEIERSRPYFIGLLGERYGWIPDEVPADILAAEPWLAEHVQGRKSVTELEILHGVLNDRKMHGHAFFYFRDPAYGINPEKFPDLTDDERRELPERDIPWEIDKLGPAEAARRTQERKDKLAALKQRIRDSKLPLVDPYAGPEALAAIIEKQFADLIDDLYPEDQTPDPLTQERFMHEAQAKNKLFACIERPAHMAALTAFSELADHGGKGLVVTGESGGGKTAMLAAWASSFIPQPSSFLFQHYFGATPDSSSPDGFLRRLLGELKVRFGIIDEIPADPDKLREALPLWLAQTTGKGRIVLVLDGLNQLRGSEADRHLVFLPRHIPPHVTVLASALPGPALDALRERGWTEHDLPRASEAEVDAMVGEYFRLLGRHVDTEGRPIQTPLRRQLVAAPGCRNPLFLRTVLEELRQFGSFEQLPARVAGYLESTTPKELFLAVLRRWQEDFDGKDPQAPDFALTRRALTHLWAAREGLSEPEWLDLLGMDPQSKIQNPESKIDAPLPRAYWTPLFLALEPHLSQRAGLFAYGHDFLRQSVEAAYAAEAPAQRAAHLSVADYFERHASQREMTPRKAAEWPFQLQAAQAWERLEACLTKIPLFIALFNDKTQWELSAYWHWLRRNGSDMGACYTAAYERWTADPAKAADQFVATQLGVFLLDNGLYHSAELLLRRALETCLMVHGSNHPATLASLTNLAVLFESQGDYAEAQTLSEQVLDVSQRIFGSDHLLTLTSLSNLAFLLYRKSDYVAAQPLYEQALVASERVLGAEHRHTQTILHNLAGLMYDKGDYVAAQSLTERTIEVRKRVLGEEHPDTLASLGLLAGLLEKRGDHAEARSLYKRVLDARELVMGEEHPDTLTSLINLAASLIRTGDFTAAQPMLEQALKQRERVLGEDHPDTLASLGLLADLQEKSGGHARAQPLYKRVLDARKRVLGEEHPDTLTSLNNLAASLIRTGDFTAAQPMLEQALKERERVLGAEHPDTLVSVNMLAELLKNKGVYATAQRLFERALAARELVLGLSHPDTLSSLNSLAGLLSRQGAYASALPLYERALETRERVLGMEHPDTLMSVNDLAVLLYRKGDHAAAQRMHERALEARERVLGAEHPETLLSANNLATLLTSIADYSGARPLYERALEGLLKISQANHRPHPNLEAFVGNYAGCLGELGWNQEQIRRALAELGQRFGFDLGGVGERGANEPSAKLRQVLEEIMGNQSINLTSPGSSGNISPEAFGEQNTQKLKLNLPKRRPPSFDIGKVGRNALCPCGSGKRFKECCGRES